jgi:hypothetical protein
VQPNCQGRTIDGSLGYALATASFQRYYLNGYMHWVTTGPPPNGYTFERTLGRLLTTPKSNTPLYALYDCVSSKNGSYFVSLVDYCEGQNRLSPSPDGYTYTTPPPDVAWDQLVQLYRCSTKYDVNGGPDHFVSTQPDCEMQNNEGTLGFALK